MAAGCPLSACLRVLFCIKCIDLAYIYYTLQIYTVSKSRWMIVEKDQDGISRPLLFLPVYRSCCNSPPLDGLRVGVPMNQTIFRRLLAESLHHATAANISSIFPMAAWSTPSVTVLGKVPSFYRVFLAKIDAVRTAICVCWRIFPLFYHLRGDWGWWKDLASLQTFNLLAVVVDPWIQACVSSAFFIRKGKHLFCIFLFFKT